MTVTRDAIYELVWARPMLAVAKDHGVSANYLARACASLNVTGPPDRCPGFTMPPNPY